MSNDKFLQVALTHTHTGFSQLDRRNGEQASGKRERVMERREREATADAADTAMHHTRSAAVATGGGNQS